MHPGEVIAAPGEIELNAGRPTLSLDVVNRGDRPIQVGSHYHFAETNPALDFDRAGARGMRLNIPAGTAVRFEPGQARTIELVAYAGLRRVYGFNAAVMGALEVPAKGAKGAKAAKAVDRAAAKTAARVAAPSKRAKPAAKAVVKRGAKR